MARGTSSTQSVKNNKIIDRLHNIIRAGGINNYVLRVDFIAILYLMRRFEEEIKSHQDDFIGEIFNKSVVLGKKVDADLYRFSRLNEITDATQLQKFINDEAIPFYRELPDIVSYPSNKKPSIYETNFYKYNSEFFRDATISKLKSGRLKEVISLVSEIESSTILSDDFLGDAVESAFANSTSAERKQMGLFRTPRHIRDLMVEMAKPTIKDKIYDPAVGTGGFLISAKKYIFDNLDLSSASENDLQKFYFNGLGGMEQDMFLHRFAMMVALTNQVNPLNIQEGDSLGNFDFVRDRESYSLILTNPPFGGEKNQDHYSNLWAMNSSETTVLFLKLMHELLTLNGRCLTVVSEGMNTWSDATSVEMRRIISEDNTLEAVISLPQGVFQNPKGGIGPKTSIYFFRKTKPQKDHKVFFYQIENDGYSIGTNRKEIEGNQIPDLLENWNLYTNGKYEEISSSNCYLIPITKITSDPIYSFNISSYLSGISQHLVEDYQKQINKINQDFQSKVKAITNGSKEATEIEKYKEPFEIIAENVAGTASVFSSLDWQFRDNLKLIDDHAKQNLEKLNSISIPSNIIASMATISDYRNLNENILKRGNTHPRIKLKKLLSQKQEKIKLNESKEYKQVTIRLYGKGVELRHRKNGHEIKTKTQYKVSKGQFLFSKIDARNGAFGIIPDELDGAIVTSSFPYFNVNTELVLPEYLKEITISKSFYKPLENIANGTTNRRSITEKQFLDRLIPVPPIDKQKELIEKIQKLREVIKGTDCVLENYTFSFIPQNSNLLPISEAIISTMNGWSPKCNGGSQKVLGLGSIQNGTINTNDNLKLTSEERKDVSKFFVKEGDFFYSRGNTKELVALSGIAYEVNDDIVFPDLMTRVVFDKNKILPEYAVVLFNSELGRQYFGNVPEGSSPSMVKVSQGYMGKFKVPLVNEIEKQKEVIKVYKDSMKFLNDVSRVKKENLRQINSIVEKIWR